MVQTHESTSLVGDAHSSGRRARGPAREIQLRLDLIAFGRPARASCQILYLKTVLSRLPTAPCLPLYVYDLYSATSRAVDTPRTIAMATRRNSK